MLFNRVNGKCQFNELIEEKTMVRLKRRAFTLIELLVVISIIALLLSILMPGLQKAKQHAMRMLCRTNLHSYGIATNMYLAEYDETFPNPWRNIYSGDNNNQPKLPGEIQPYCRWHNPIYALEGNEEYQGPLWSFLEAEEINLCPVFEKLGTKYGELHLPGSCIGAPFEGQFGYSQNAYLGAPSPDYDWVDGRVMKASEVKSPARTFVFGEENPWPMNTSANTWDGEPYDLRLSGMPLNDTALVTRLGNRDSFGDITDCFGTFHSPPGGDYNEGTTNVVMMDGSIEAVQPFNDGTFRKAWPRLGGKFKPDDRPDLK
jgi:prepilin-type N-terminal cleavage/methylation domain-containing protein